MLKMILLLSISKWAALMPKKKLGRNQLILIMNHININTQIKKIYYTNPN